MHISSARPWCTVSALSGNPTNPCDVWACYQILLYRDSKADEDSEDVRVSHVSVKQWVCDRVLVSSDSIIWTNCSDWKQGHNKINYLKNKHKSTILKLSNNYHTIMRMHEHALLTRVEQGWKRSHSQGGAVRCGDLLPRSSSHSACRSAWPPSLHEGLREWASEMVRMCVCVCVCVCLCVIVR